jgi:ABC-type transporter Mla MlaB component
MLKITTHSESKLDILELEGRLVGPWIEELEKCWRQATSADHEIHVVLKQVAYIDDEGRALLAAMHRAGVKLEATGCMTNAVIAEIVGGEKSRPQISKM